MPKYDRRQFLKVAGGGLCLTMVAPHLSVAQPVRAEKFVLPDLPYAADALEPVIDSKTMEVHHGKHHQAYVNNLNKALEGVPLPSGSSLERILTHLDSLPEDIRTTVRQNGGGHYNHSLFWPSMRPPGSEDKAPKNDLAAAMISTFGSLDTFQERFVEAGLGVFGSGWVWLVCDPSQGALSITTTANQDCPLMGEDNLQPLLGNDCWEHAYYLSYQNRRGDYLKAWWDLVDWSVVEKRFEVLS